MKRLIRGLVLTVGALVVLAGAGIAYLAAKRPASRPPSSETIEATPARLARGEYLALHVVDCLLCHSEVRFERFGLPRVPGSEGKGGFRFGREFDVPGVVYARNITPDPETGLGKWTDGEILRAVREGVDRDGKALFPMMPYGAYREMSDEDARAIVAYLRTLRPIRNTVPPKKLDFPVNLLVKGAPKPVDGQVASPDPKADPVAYGQYLTVIAGCKGCHTPETRPGAPIPGREYAGGRAFRGPWGRNVTPNLTSHKDSYLGRATKEEFIGRFRSFAGLTGDAAPVATKGRNTVMPWLALSGMTDEDLGAIYDFLKTLPPIENKVNPFPDAPDPAPEAPARTAER
jgi:mono/diheme cytochrome c family protein